MYLKSHYYLIFYGFLFFNFHSLKAHPLHVSTTAINYNIENSSLEIALKVFTEDIESALELWKNLNYI